MAMTSLTREEKEKKRKEEKGKGIERKGKELLGIGEKRLRRVLGERKKKKEEKRNSKTWP